jgi:hypothetical protein
MMKTAGQILDRLIEQPFDALSTKDAFHRIGLLIDLSGDLKREDGTARALECAEQAGSRSIGSRSRRASHTVSASRVGYCRIHR